MGPQFFRGLKSDGVPQVIFSVLQCLVSLFTAYLVARFLGYDAGAAAGLLAGSQTISAVLGVATDAVNQLPIPADQKTALINNMPVAYAVTYLFGTAGSAWLLASIGPKLLRVDLAEECKKLEAKMGGGETELGVISLSRRFDVRAYRVTNPNMMQQNRRRAGSRGQGGARFHPADPSRVRHHRSRALHDHSAGRCGRCGNPSGGSHRAGGPNRTRGGRQDPARLSGEMLDVVVTNKTLAGKTLADLAGHEFARGVFLRQITRAGRELPFTPGNQS